MGCLRKRRRRMTSCLGRLRLSMFCSLVRDLEEPTVEVAVVDAVLEAEGPGSPRQRDDDDTPIFLLRSSSFCFRQSRPLNGNLMGKVEGQGESWQGHVTAVTLVPEYCRQQLAKKLMNLLEDFSDKIDKTYFLDLFVRASNTPAIKMYEKMWRGFLELSWVLHIKKGAMLLFGRGRRVSRPSISDMRKALSRDAGKKSIIPLKRPVTPAELEYD
ncbi:hypothetical protein CRYUN_Cryun01aG0172400 [Craigia yunnanensis]